MKIQNLKFGKNKMGVTLLSLVLATTPITMAGCDKKTEQSNNVSEYSKELDKEEEKTTAIVFANGDTVSIIDCIASEYTYSSDGNCMVDFVYIDDDINKKVSRSFKEEDIIYGLDMEYFDPVYQKEPALYLYYRTNENQFASPVATLNDKTVVFNDYKKAYAYGKACIGEIDGIEKYETNGTENKKEKIILEERVIADTNLKKEKTKNITETSKKLNQELKALKNIESMWYETITTGNENDKKEFIDYTNNLYTDNENASLRK